TRTPAYTADPNVHSPRSAERLRRAQTGRGPAPGRIHMTGQSPAAWIRERRLERARILLQTTDRSVTDVALEVGFASVSHFVHGFRHRFRETPQQIRKNQKRQRMGQLRKT